jgi:hypothetical protein
LIVRGSKPHQALDGLFDRKNPLSFCNVPELYDVLRGCFTPKTTVVSYFERFGRMAGITFQQFQKNKKKCEQQDEKS